MSAITVNRDDGASRQPGLFVKLLSKLGSDENSVEVMLQSVPAGSAMWIDPAENPDTVEFFYILSGSVTLHNENDLIELAQNDSFYVKGLKKTVLMSSKEDLKMLYVVTTPLFVDLACFRDDLQALADKVEAKDMYTRGHGRRVMQYSVALAEKLGLNDISTQNLVVAALFHDVGKCSLSDEILQKAGPLTSEEYRQIIKHPIGSRRLLEPRFGHEIAYIAQCHHERLDGSGYPYGLKGSDLCIEARIIAVADSFDAITSQRTYNKPRSFQDAVKELLSLPELYDKKVAEALDEIVQSGELDTTEASK
ncbi:MAG: HD domain-containing protein [Bacillota bacterium]|nr:HD domain-containing protein [Bacillota bacterium]